MPKIIRHSASFQYGAVIPTREEILANKIWVGNLDLRITEHQVVEMFKPYGTIVNFEFAFHRGGEKHGRPKGFCFLEYSSRMEAERAMAAMDERLVNERRLCVKFANERKEESTDKEPQRQRRTDPMRPTPVRTLPEPQPIASLESMSETQKKARIHALQAKIAMLEGRR
eukprot:TRINITY_DN359_c0_g1_i6.p2 TRINITY_DN359_c0_g1~~TRINITY_DN359_c0_g1_i6.p2  ORF type:complete len:170 (-),score=31.41 TRINITY_DN359_c0_g1_i6:1136-1645(-)